MTGPALLAVAHGSPDPRAEPILDALLARIQSERPEVVTALAFLGHVDPDVSRAVAGLADQGISEVVVVPLLLASAYHAKSDLPGLLRRARLEYPGLATPQAPVLGPHPLLFDLVRRRIAEAGIDPEASLILGAVGSSDAAANAEVADVAASLGATVGFAAGTPAIGDVVAGLRARRAKQVVVATYALAPGRLVDRLQDSGADIVTEVLGAAPEVVDIVLQRYDSVVRSTQRLVGSA